MPLEEYRKKRNFRATSEPAGRARRAGRAQTFVVQKHDASHLHYDFRLAIDGVLVSWAVLKGPTLDSSVKRFATMTEDHPLEYADLEGVIPEGEYGAGTVMVWDRGSYELEEEMPAEEQLARGEIKIILQGKKLHGGFVLVHMGRATTRPRESVKKYPISERNVVVPRQEFLIASCNFEAFTVEHSFIAPAVGYRISKGAVSIFYFPDLVSIHERHEALTGIVAYIGDGASISRPLVRRRGKTLIGHASVREQLDWCRVEKVERVVVTHCGSQIVAGQADSVEAKISALARDRGITINIARDGMEATIRRSGIHIRP